MFCDSHSGLKRRKNVAFDVLTHNAPHPTQGKVLDIVIFVAIVKSA